jgi:hypothetical protein
MRLSILLLCGWSAACQFSYQRALQPGEIRGKLVYEEPGTGERKPAAGARVRLEGTTLGAAADDEGGFRFRDVPTGKHTVHAKFAVPVQSGEPLRVEVLVPGVEIATRSTGTGKRERNGRDLGTVLLLSLSTVSGRVTKAGDPVAGAQVVAQGFPAATTGDDGTYALRIPRGRHELAAVYPDLPATRVTAAVSLQARETHTQDFAATSADATAGTLAGVATYASAEEGDASGIRIRLRAADGTLLFDAAGAEVTTDASGLWAAADVPAGVYTLLASAPGYRTMYAGALVVYPGAQAPAVVLDPEPQNPVTADCDRDGEGDAADLDDDGDGSPDDEDACDCDPADHLDGDEDGVCDLYDVAPLGTPPCTDVVDDALCGAGKICVSGACVPGNCHVPQDCPAGHTCGSTFCETVFSTATAGTSYAVGSNTAALLVKIWGAGGGGTDASGSGGCTTGRGGAGGYAEGLVSVTAAETLTVLVGGGGGAGVTCNGCGAQFGACPQNNGGLNGGGRGGCETSSRNQLGGGGGGYSGLFRSGTPLLIAGGGGGGSSGCSGSAFGGGGGGASGGDGVRSTNNTFCTVGGGGTQSGGGAAGPSEGSACELSSAGDLWNASANGGNGGDSCGPNTPAGGGGGGGFQGGGGGGGAFSSDGCSGGGGSGWVAATGVAGGSTAAPAAGDWPNPPNATAAGYDGSAGKGGAGAPGADGLVVIIPQ